MYNRYNYYNKLGYLDFYALELADCLQSSCEKNSLPLGLLKPSFIFRLFKVHKLSPFLPYYIFVNAGMFIHILCNTKIEIKISDSNISTSDMTGKH